MGQKFDTKGKSLSEILRMRDELERKAEEHFEKFQKARTEATRRAGRELKPQLDEIYADCGRAKGAANAAAEDANACEAAVVPHLDDGKVLLYIPSGSKDVKAIYLNAMGDLVVATAEWASGEVGSAEPLERPDESNAGAVPPVVRKVVEAVRSAVVGEGDVGISVQRLDPDMAELMCPCAKCQARRDEAAGLAESSPVVEDQAAS